MAVKAPVIAGKYTLLRRLGHGGMAEVFLAKQVSEGGFEKLVVLKRILPHLATGAEFVTMFLDEARVAADLRHPNIVTIVDVGRAGETLFMVMEFLHGQDVRKLQRKVAAFGQMIPFAHACQMVIDSAAGLHYAHTKLDLQGRPLDIVHRDVSPQNIIVSFEGGTKIVDFGIAKAAGQSTHTSTGVLKGKYTYMSPEQAQGEVVDPRTDQFALGIVLWELLTMRRLFKRDSEGQTLEAIIDGPIPRPKRFREDCPASIEDVVMTALSRDKNRRFRDCEAMAFALEDALAKEAIVHSPSRLAQYMRRLFADQLAEEASLGVVQPDGSLSVKNTFPMADRRDVEKEKEKEAPRMADREESVVAPDAPPDATQADRKRTRSRSEDARTAESKAAKAPPRSTTQDAEPRDPEPRDQRRDQRRDRDRDPNTDRVRAMERGRDRDVDRVGDRGLDRGGGSRRGVMIAAGVAVVGVAGVVVGAVTLGNQKGPGILVVRSEPRGARVFLDGKDTGQNTPALLKGVLAGEPHKLRLVLEDHRDLEEIATIPKKGATHEVKYDLETK